MGGFSEGELQRRTDMVARLQDDCEKLSKMVTIARLTSRGMGAAAGGPSVSAAVLNPASDSDREALLGPAAKPFTRVFGAAPKVRETEETRPLDDRGLLSLQEMKVQQQDDQLAQITTILQRQRHLGEAISHEITLQNELLDDLSYDVDKASAKLATNNKQMRRLG